MLGLHAYQMSSQISSAGYPFYALIAAAMRQADSTNVAKLRLAFPEAWNELQERYNAPGGLLKHELEAANG